jgi:hypothetical protein
MMRLASTRCRAVVARINAGIVGCTIDGDSEGASYRERCGSASPGECRGDAKVATLLLSNGTNVSGDFGKILVEAEDNRHVERAGKGPAKGINCNSHVDPFLLLVTKRVSGAIGQGERFRSKAERATEGRDSFLAHRPQLALPKGIPEGVVAGAGNAGIKPRFLESPVLILADRLGQAQHVKIRIVVPEGALRLVKQVLAINVGYRLREERAGGRGRWSVRSRRCRHKKEPTRALRHVGWVRNLIHLSAQVKHTCTKSLAHLQ